MMNTINGGKGGGRQSALGVLNDKIKRKLQEIKELETIIDNINWDNLSEKEESQLWDYFIKNNR